MGQVADKVLYKVITKSVEPSIQDTEFCLAGLTHFVDGVAEFDTQTERLVNRAKETSIAINNHRRIDNTLWIKRPAELTKYEVIAFEPNQLFQALAFMLSVGIENSVLLNQEFAVVPGQSIDLSEDNLETLDAGIEDIQPREYNGFLVVCLNEINWLEVSKLYEQALALNADELNARCSDLYDLQIARYEQLTQFFDSENWNFRLDVVWTP